MANDGRRHRRVGRQVRLLHHPSLAVDPQIFYVVPRPNFPSRVYGGIHFRFDCDEGLKLGRAVARLAIQHAGR